MLYSHPCYTCGETTEPRLIVVASVVNICCGSCLSHIRYGHVNELPHVDIIKLHIWHLVEGDMWLIDRAKWEMGFRQMYTYVNYQLQYYKLYEKLVYKKRVYQAEKKEQTTKAITQAQP